MQYLDQKPRGKRARPVAIGTIAPDHPATCSADAPFASNGGGDGDGGGGDANFGRSKDGGELALSRSNWLKELYLQQVVGIRQAGNNPFD